MIAPTLATDRLSIEPLEAGRFEEHFANMSDERVVRFLGTGAPQPRIEAWRRFCQGAGLWPLLGYGYWSIVERATNRMIGMGGLACFERGVPELENVAEAGWAFAYDAWGRGIASEFLDAVLKWADEALALPEIRCIIAAENIASVRVATKNGFLRGGETVDQHGPVDWYVRPTPGAPSRR